jgi:3-oxoacyl-[acyl-carrier-protein] synthase II
MDSNLIVITGAEMVTSLGASRETTWRAVARGECGMRELTALESPLPEGKLGGQAVDLPAEFESQLPREVRYLKWTINRALAEAAVLDSRPYEPHRCGLMLGTTLHGMRQAGTYLRTGDYTPLQQFLAGNTLASAAGDFGISGFAATTCSACSSSLGSVALGATLLQSGELDLVICGGYDTISEYAYGGFNSLRLVAPGPLRPFAKDRQGMKLGEGYGIVILERASDANRRSATILAQLLGWGESADAHHLTQPHPQGEGAARAMTMALHSANLNPTDIGLIAAHATGTHDNDAAEYAALLRVFGADLPRVPVVGFKSHLGHTLGGAGAVEMILAMTAMREQLVPPTANLAAGDIEFPDLQLNTGQAKPASIRATLSTSLGFGGANTSVILGPPPVAPQSSAAIHIAPRGDREVFITGVGVIVPGAIGNDQFLKRLTDDSPDAWHRDTGAVPEEQFLHLLNARRVRRMSDQVKLTLAATALACKDAGIDDIPAFADECGAILGSSHGSANYSVAYYSEIITQGLIGANPMLFAEGVPNACSAHLSLMLGVKGACQTIIGTRTSGLDALRLASMRIAQGQWDRAIVGAAEEYSDIINQSYRACGQYVGVDGGAPFSSVNGFVTGASAVTWILESRAAMEARGGRPHGRVLGGASSRLLKGDQIATCRHVLTQLDSPTQIVTSANGTWIDRAELAAICRSCEGATVSSIYGHVAESFSAGPLLGLSAALISQKLPRLRGQDASEFKTLISATGDEKAKLVTSLCTDYSGLVAGVRINLSA